MSMLKLNAVITAKNLVSSATRRDIMTGQPKHQQQGGPSSLRLT
jgi:hypothetical protein